jgi:hypothetical protein
MDAALVRVRMRAYLNTNGTPLYKGAEYDLPRERALALFQRGQAEPATATVQRGGAQVEAAVLPPFTTRKRARA